MKTVITNNLFNQNLVTVFVVDRAGAPKPGESFIFGGSNGDNQVYVVIRHQGRRMQEFIDTTSDVRKQRTGPNPNIEVPFSAGKVGLVSRKIGKHHGIVQS